MQKQTLRHYPLFVGLTRPPMIFGVTQTFLIFSFMPCMILFFLTKNILLAAGTYVIAHVAGMVCCWKDQFIFDVLLGKYELTCPNRDYWGCNSYDPS